MSFSDLQIERGAFRNAIIEKARLVKSSEIGDINKYKDTHIIIFQPVGIIPRRTEMNISRVIVEI